MEQQQVTRQDLADLKAEVTAQIAAVKAELLSAVNGLAEQAAASNRNQFARLQNSLASDGTRTPYMMLVREKATAGAAALGAEPPAGFPVTKDSLSTLTAATITLLAQHYGEEFAAGDGVVARRKALARFIGVPW
ncbi:hypothetical protein HXX76_002019 [Chlamydomonas incerta]|uniref:Uncharacterized protein n=1 Tax=Chlamydomonas incerta TaxID=51695 RepID=A0A835WA94_CHLIN|nr:hypothetical protein HXX76_002019 [Chlamydomonas incerta]|eukprot:KAG2443671.1 hypothetical protein HXX76_002019 [Chlamydomonas incerta]